MKKYQVWILFLFACFQQAFLFPEITVIFGERTGVFSGILCLATLVSVIAVHGIKGNNVRVSEIAISIVLWIIPILSSLSSASPMVSLTKSFVIVSSMLGGYWTSRLLLNNIENRRLFTHFCLCLLLGIIIMAFTGFVTRGSIFSFVDYTSHPVVSRILLLSFAPISLLFSASAPLFRVGLVTLVLAYCCMAGLGYFGGVESILVIISGLVFFALIFLRKTRVLALTVVAIISISLIGSYDLLCPKILARDSGSVALRMENLFFSTSVALENPLLGIGPSTPRSTYWDTHEIRYPFISKHDFLRWSKDSNTSENVVLTFLADLGFPFVILYLTALVCLLWKLARLAWRPPPEYYPHPLAMLLAIVGAFVHFQLFDGPYLPQTSWFFHILMGMILFVPDLGLTLKPNRKTEFGLLCKTYSTRNSKPQLP